MGKNVLLLGRTGVVLDGVKEKLSLTDVTLFAGTTLEDVQNLFEEQEIDTVIMGAGIDLESRLEIIRVIFELSNSTTVHMKDRDSGPEGMQSFVTGVLNGFKNIQ